MRQSTLWLVLMLGLFHNQVGLAESTGTINQFFEGINGVIFPLLFWDGHPLKLPFILVVLVSGGLFFSFYAGFVNIRFFKHGIDIVRGRYDDPKDPGQINHFQALTSALSATVGLGNIAGVAVAVSIGGPGAVFWMWVVAFFGMCLKFSSCTFAQMYRRKLPGGHILGGPMVYIEEGIKEAYPRYKHLGKALAVIFAICTIGASFGGGNLFQANQAFELISNEFPAVASYDWLIGMILSFLVGVVMLGGISRIGDVTSRLVPLMCLFYVGCCLYIVLGNIALVPGIFSEIFHQAFRPEATFGGFLAVVIQGMRRGAFSNEAGIGSAAIAHAAAKTKEPVREGMVAMLGPFIDTHIVCTLTALAIISTGSYLNPELAGKGAAITAEAFKTVGPWATILLTIASVIFAYSTIISWSYYGEKATEYLFGSRARGVYRGVYVFAVALGPILSLSAVLDFADALLLSMAFPNIIVMIFLAPKLKSALADYTRRFKAGEFATYK